MTSSSTSVSDSASLIEIVASLSFHQMVRLMWWLTAFPRTLICPSRLSQLSKSTLNFARLRFQSGSKPSLKLQISLQTLFAKSQCLRQQPTSGSTLKAAAKPDTNQRTTLVSCGVSSVSKATLNACWQLMCTSSHPKSRSNGSNPQSH